MADVTNDEANDLADEILSRSEFIPAGEPGPVGRVVDWIGDKIGEFFDWLGRIFGGVGGGAGKVLAILLLVLAAAVLLFAIYKAIVGRAPKAELVEKGARVVFDEVVEPAELRDMLAASKAESDWRGAVVAGFRLAVVELIDQNVAREIAGATTGDFVRAVQERRPELLDAYVPASMAFERAFYSDLEIVRGDVDLVEAALGRLQAVGTR